MTQLYDVTLNREITRLVSALTDQSINLITNTALDGTTYIQVIGQPSFKHELEVYVNEAGKKKLEEAEAGCNLLRVSVSIGTLYGRIVKKSIKKMAGGRWYQAIVVLAAEEVT